MNRGIILEQAKTLTNTDRQQSYGTPLSNFTRIANFWSSYLEIDITPEQAAMCMALVKVSRSMQSKEVDNYIDGAAYFAIAGELSNDD
jgi:hypothetical protein